ncbi:MAG: HAMP domain-containing protein [Archangium sp.]|nr:HAMP domain-containing protein [Archangium sp.]
MKLSLTTRIFLGYAVVLVTFGAVSGFSVLTLRQNQLEMRLVSEGYLELSQTVVLIENLQASQARDNARLRDEPSLETRKGLTRLARLYFPGSMATYLTKGKALAAEVVKWAPESERPFVADVSKRLTELEMRFAEYEAASDATFLLFESPTLDIERAGAALDRLQLTEKALLASIRLLHGSLESRIRDHVRLTQERERRTGVAIILLPVVAIGVGLLATGLAARSLRPVRTLIDAVSRIRRGDFAATIDAKGEDEIAVLAREFDAMAKALREREAQLQQKQQELLRAERLAAVGRVSAQVAHEIRNPLSSIGLNVEMLQDQVGSGSFTFKTADEAREATHLLASVMREVDRLTEITEDYLRLARLPTPAKRPEDLRKIVEDVLGFAKEELERAGLKIESRLGTESLPISADEGQLRQVLLNLIRNAREAMAAGGTLTVEATSKDTRLEVRVKDTGAGIPPDVREKLFEPFFTTKQGGTGLGLPLSRQIIEAHGGTISVESEVGVGTTFLLSFPRAP